MKNKDQHILIISYVFPPYPGVGGRRWAKFVKYFAQNGFKVHVITAKNPFNQLSLFADDVKDKNIFVRTLPGKYPFSLIKNVESVWDKIKYRLDLYTLKFKEKGNYFDRGIGWNKILMKNATDIIRQYAIDNVIVTGAPFSILYFATDLKKQFPGINLISDIRDPWTWGIGYGMQSISDKRKKVEKERELKVIRESDIVSVPTEEMKNTLCSIYSDFGDKIKVVPHAYDPSEIGIAEKEKERKGRLVFYGTLYDGIEIPFLRVINSINANKAKLDIYSPLNDKMRSTVIKLLNSRIQLKSPVPPKILFDNFRLYDYVLIIQPEIAKNFITTKIYEIIYSGIPIILIAEEGVLSRLIIDHNLGIHLLPSEIDEGMERILKMKVYDVSSHSFPIYKYSFEQVSKEVASYFI